MHAGLVLLDTVVLALNHDAKLPMPHIKMVQLLPSASEEQVESFIDGFVRSNLASTIDNDAVGGTSLPRGTLRAS